VLAERHRLGFVDLRVSAKLGRPFRDFQSDGGGAWSRAARDRRSGLEPLALAAQLVRVTLVDLRKQVLSAEVPSLVTLDVPRTGMRNVPAGLGAV
jgi:hypothetical protein